MPSRFQSVEHRANINTNITPENSTKFFLEEYFNNAEYKEGKKSTLQVQRRPVSVSPSSSSSLKLAFFFLEGGSSVHSYRVQNFQPRISTPTHQRAGEQLILG